MRRIAKRDSLGKFFFAHLEQEAFTGNNQLPGYGTFLLKNTVDPIFERAT